MLVKTDVNDIIRDTETGALLNKNVSGLEAYKKAKQRNSEIDQLKIKIKEIDAIKEDVAEIKSLLTKIAEKL
jgi:predicted DNA-binding protein YlxM (UPF0122 family)